MQKSASDTLSSLPTEPIFFEIASIKPGRDDEPLVQQLLPDGFIFRGGSLPRLICIAYDRTLLFNNRSRLKSVPDWVRDDIVDITAKVSAGNSKEWERQTQSSADSPAFKVALERLLYERYKLRTHTEPMEVYGYALVLKNPTAKAKIEEAESTDGSDDASISIQSGGVIQFHSEPILELATFISSLSLSLSSGGQNGDASSEI